MTANSDSLRALRTNDLRRQHRHHDTRERVASVLQPQPLLIDVDAVCGQRLRVLVDQLPLDPLPFGRQQTGTEEVADVAQRRTVTGRLPVDGGDRVAAVGRREHQVVEPVVAMRHRHRTIATVDPAADATAEHVDQVERFGRKVLRVRWPGIPAPASPTARADGLRRRRRFGVPAIRSRAASGRPTGAVQPCQFEDRRARLDRWCSPRSDRPAGRAQGPRAPARSLRSRGSTRA